MSNPGSQRFSRADRLRRPAEFLRVRQEGERFDSRFFLVRYALSPTGQPRLGLVVTKRIGNAVVRNRCKRRVRELFRRSRAGMAVPADIAVVARRALSGGDCGEIEIAWQGLLRRIEKWHQRQTSATGGAA